MERVKRALGEPALKFESSTYRLRIMGTNERKADINGRTWYVALTKRF